MLFCCIIIVSPPFTPRKINEIDFLSLGNLFSNNINLCNVNQILQDLLQKSANIFPLIKLCGKQIVCVYKTIHNNMTMKLKNLNNQKCPLIRVKNARETNVLH